MKKNILFWFASLVAVMLTLSLSSCSDKDDEPDDNTPQSMIVGRWVCELNAYGDPWEEPLVYKFDADGGGYQWFQEYPYSYRDEYTYSITDSKIIFRWEDGYRVTVRYEFLNNGKEMVMYGWDDDDMEELYFVKQ